MSVTRCANGLDSVAVRLRLGRDSAEVRWWFAPRVPGAARVAPASPRAVRALSSGAGACFLASSACPGFVPRTEPMSPIRRGNAVPWPFALPIAGGGSIVGGGRDPVTAPARRAGSARPAPANRPPTGAGAGRSGTGTLGAGPLAGNRTVLLGSHLGFPATVRPMRPPSAGRRPRGSGRTGATGSSEEDAMSSTPPSRSTALGPDRPYRGAAIRPGLPAGLDRAPCPGGGGRPLRPLNTHRTGGGVR